MLPLRYVILCHEGIEDPHFDLMFEWEAGSPLMSVRLDEWPPTPRTVMERVPHHRRAYLEYEGPVSGGRGQVRRVAGGTCSVEMDREDSLVLRLDDGTVLHLPRATWD